jgi:hypothetical protein
MPLSLVSKSNYSNDIFSVYSTFIDMYQLKSQITICGDNVCSIFENPLICPEDCYTPENVTYVLKNPTLPCVNNSECLSNSCNDYRCTYLTVNQVCYNDNQCLSEECTLGKCEQSSLSQKIDNAKNELFGYDEFTSNIIALIVTILISLGVIVAIAIMTKNGMVAGVSGFIVLSGCLVFFTFFGWLSSFILIGVFILIIGLIMLYVFTKSSSG